MSGLVLGRSNGERSRWTMLFLSSEESAASFSRSRARGAIGRIKIDSPRRRISMNTSAARQGMSKPSAKDGLRAAIGAGACAATIALMPLSALAHTSAVSDAVSCGRTCKPAAAFDPAGLLTNGGGVVQVSGPISCRAGDSVRIRATVSQVSTGAVAEGLWSKRCTGTELHWHITAIVTDGVHFSAGGAEGVGLAIIRRQGTPGSAVQWIRRLALKAA
jgi:hypothetical protein